MAALGELEYYYVHEHTELELRQQKRTWELVEELRSGNQISLPAQGISLYCNVAPIVAKSLPH